ncbi:MAG: DUF4956 domain-containing protein [Chloroflexi bacterium]|nr:DUF4956 domain-containing protein [Chloroflexota bacterium]
MFTTLEFILGFLFNFAVALVVVRFIYYPMTHNKPYVFTFLAFNTVIYFILRFLTSVEMSVGVGFVLFAIFTILRYRTDPIPIREMTYLFVIAALPIMNSSGAGESAWLELVFANLTVMAILYGLEKGWGFHYETHKRITYENIELIKPENYPLLMADLRNRTGLKIKRCSVGKVNFLRDIAEITIFYDDPEQQSWLEPADPEFDDYTAEDNAI